MASIGIVGNAGYGKIVYRKNVGIEARLADLMEDVWTNGNHITRENPQEFYDGSVSYSATRTFPDHPELDVIRRDGRGYQFMTVKGAYVKAVIAKLRAVE